MYGRRPSGHGGPPPHHGGHGSHHDGPPPRRPMGPPPGHHGLGPMFGEPPPPPPPFRMHAPFGLRLRRPICPHEMMRVFDALRRIKHHYPISAPDIIMLEGIFGRRILPHEVNEITRWLDTEYGIH